MDKYGPFTIIGGFILFIVMIICFWMFLVGSAADSIMKGYQDYQVYLDQKSDANVKKCKDQGGKVRWNSDMRFGGCDT